MRVLLVFPPKVSDYGKPRHPPLGLSYIAAVLKSRGHEVMAIDMRLEGCGFEALKRIIEEFKPELAGAGCTSFSFNEAIDVLEFAKGVDKRIKTLIGGPHVALCTKNVIGRKAVDFAIVGEAEQSMTALADALENGSGLGRIKGLAYKRKGKPILPSEAALVEDLDNLPFPAFDVFPLGKYRVRGKLILPVMTSRGCPYSCIYCASHRTHGKKFRPRKPENVVNEIEHHIRKYGAREFSIIDDNFNLDIGRAKKICDGIIARKLMIRWSCDQGIRADRTDRELFMKMKRSGCSLVAIGVESANNDILMNLRKGETVERIAESIANAKKAGLIVKGFFIIGSPGDSMEKVMNSVRFFKQTGIDIPRFSMMTPYPGSAMWDWMKKNSKLLKDPDEYITGSTHWGTVDVLYETKEFSKEEMVRAYRIAEDEAEKWIIRSFLKRKLGYAGTLSYQLLKYRPVRLMAKRLYKSKMLQLK